MHESLKLEQKASVDFMWAKKCHSESHAKKTSAVHGPPRSCGVKSGCPATKGMLWALPLLRGSTGLPGTPGSRDSCPCLCQVCDNWTVFSSWMELVPGCYIGGTDWGVCPKANEKETLASRDGGSAPLGYCFIWFHKKSWVRKAGAGNMTVNFLDYSCGWGLEGKVIEGEETSFQIEGQKIKCRSVLKAHERDVHLKNNNLGGKSWRWICVCVRQKLKPSRDQRSLSLFR